MNNIEQGGKLSFKNKCYVLALLTLTLLGIVLFNSKFPALRGELSDTLFIATLFVTLINVFRTKK